MSRILAALAFVVLAAASTFAAVQQIVRPQGTAPGGNYSPGILIDGMTPSDVVSVRAYLTDGARFPRFNAVSTAYFKDSRPTRTTVVVAKLVG